MKHRSAISKLLLLVILSISGSGIFTGNGEQLAAGKYEIPVFSANLDHHADHTVRTCYEAENSELNEDDHFLYPVLAKTHSILARVLLASYTKHHQSGLVRPRLFLLNQALLL